MGAVKLSYAPLNGDLLYRFSQALFAWFGKTFGAEPLFWAGRCLGFARHDTKLVMPANGGICEQS
jgi:hypothetical protein